MFVDGTFMRQTSPAFGINPLNPSGYFTYHQT